MDADAREQYESSGRFLDALDAAEYTFPLRSFDNGRACARFDADRDTDLDPEYRHTNEFMFGYNYD